MGILSWKMKMPTLHESYMMNSGEPTNRRAFSLGNETHPDLKYIDQRASIPYQIKAYLPKSSKIVIN